MLQKLTVISECSPILQIVVVVVKLAELLLGPCFRIVAHDFGRFLRCVVHFKL